MSPKFPVQHLTDLEALVEIIGIFLGTNLFLAVTCSQNNTHKWHVSLHEKKAPGFGQRLRLVREGKRESPTDIQRAAAIIIRCTYARRVVLQPLQSKGEARCTQYGFSTPHC